VTDIVMSPDQVDAFLAEPITAQLATNGPTIRPVWFGWEGGAFWIISGPWAKLLERVRHDPKVGICVEVSDFEAGRVMQVCAYGDAEVCDYDVERARRVLHRFLGPDEASWSEAPDDYRGYVRDGGPDGAVFLRVQPRTLTAMNFSYARTRSAA
jgi:nitroimidazol reductase NimA-like FMN-containing flavoprotein (pyridoxamine 5'-phosphate oxidase superfamily)